MRWKEHVPVAYGAGFEDGFGLFPGEPVSMDFCCALNMRVPSTSGPIDPSSPEEFSDGFGGDAWPNTGSPVGFCISHRFSSTWYGVPFAAADAPRRTTAPASTYSATAVIMLGLLGLKPEIH